MKPNLLNQVILVVIVVSALLICLIACKKDKLTDPPISNNHEDLRYDPETNLVVQRIKRFDNQLKEIKKGTYRSDAYIDIDSAMWNIESLFNTTYSFPDKKYVAKSIQELTLDIDVHNGKLLMNDVGSLYDDLVASVRDVYSNDGFVTDKGLLSVFVEKGEVRSDGLGVKVIVVTGKTADYQEDYEPILYGPFDADECWYYGEYGGSCYDPMIFTDAAELLEDTINYIHAYRPVQNQEYRNIYVSMTCVSLMGNEYWDDVNNDYYLYYKVDCDEDCLYLDANELNHYYYNEVEVIKKLVPKDPGYSSLIGRDYVFMEVNIDGLMGYNNVSQSFVYMHNNNIFYGMPYCVLKDEFGMPKDILYN